MKSLVLIAVTFILFCTNGNSQTVSFSGKNVAFTQVFAAIKAQTGYVFFYDADLLREAKPVTIDLKNVSVEEALRQTFKDQPFGWVIENQTVSIIKKPQPLPIVQEAQRIP